MAAGHASRESSEPRSVVAAEVAFDVVADSPVVAHESPGGDAPTRRPRAAASPVSPSTHAHAYPVSPDHDAVPHDPSIVHAPFVGAPLPDAPAPVVPVRFAMTVIASGELPGSKTEAGGPPTADGSGALRREEAPTLEGDVSLPARLASSLAPVYPPAAREDGAEADVVLVIVVSSTGTVTEVGLAADAERAAASGFEEAALRALRDARFIPAQRDGKPVAVRMRWTVSFRLR